MLGNLKVNFYFFSKLISVKTNYTAVPSKRVLQILGAPLERENDKIEWLTEDQACELLGITKKTIQNYVSSGRIPSSFYVRSFDCKRLYNKNKLLIL